MADKPEKTAPVEETQAEETPAPAPKGTMYFRNTKYAGQSFLLSVKDKLDASTVVKEKFTQYYDTFKGDVVRVGYLATDNKEVIKRCKRTGWIETIDKKQYEKDTEELNQAPVAAA